MSQSTNQNRTKAFWRRGEPLVWTAGAALTITLMFTLLLIGVVLVNGLGYFWPHNLTQLDLADGSHRLGEVKQHETSEEGTRRIQLKIGNRDVYGLDFGWFDLDEITAQSRPEDAVVLERREYGNFHGYLESLSLDDLDISPGKDDWETLQIARDRVADLLDDTHATQKRMANLGQAREAIRQRMNKLEPAPEKNATHIADLQAAGLSIDKQFAALDAQLTDAISTLSLYTARLADADGQEIDVPLFKIVRAYRPNQMSLIAKMGFYGGKVVELFIAQPRESNTEGGLFPAIFGTVLMVLLMSLFCIPLGVIAAIYLREYAKEGFLVRMVRIAVNNLAGVPSIVYGVFGLGFFVYGLGSAIDSVFFSDQLPTPTFGTGGVLWASLTLALLTVPVVIVATEESLAAVPRGIREGSLALGATRFQTLTRILLPMASPGIMTGLILAMARAAGEVAPLMIVGVVKLAPALPIDGQFPFMHLNRKFMHLGFHIYDVGFQSPNVEAAKPMVFVTTMLLVLIVILMSVVAIYLRNSMRKRFTTGIF